MIRNTERFPSYKGKLAIYNAAVGLIQGYTPDKSYILGKSWKYTTRGTTEKGYNCFDLLGEINYNDEFDNKYINLNTVIENEAAWF